MPNMRNAKMHKIFLTVAIAVLMLVVSLFPLFNKTVAKATVSSTEAHRFFSGFAQEKMYFGDGYFNVKVNSDSENANLSAEDEDSAKEKNVLTITNLLVVHDFAIELEVADGLDSLTVIIKNESYYENGNPMVKRDESGNLVSDGAGGYVYEVKKEIINELKFDFTTGIVMMNGDDNNTANFERDGSNRILIKTNVIDNYLNATIGSETLVARDVEFGPNVIEYRKIKSIDQKPLGQFKFMFDVANDVNEESPYIFKIASVNYMVSDLDGKHLQTFETDADGILTDKNVYPRVSIDESFYKKQKDGSYVIIKDVMQKYTLALKSFAVLNDVTTSDICLATDDDNVWLDPSVSKPKAVRFNAEKSNYTLELRGISDALYETIENITIVNFDEDTIAPEYVLSTDVEYDPIALFSFELALKDAYYNDEEGHYVALGDDVQIPSLKDLVFDNYFGYESITKTVYYTTETAKETELSGNIINLTAAGNYVFYLTAQDGIGNSMNKASFKEDTDFTSSLAPVDYTDYVFNFYVADDAPITVKEPVAQGTGYVGVEYVASAFDINAEGCKLEYKLYYNANPNAVYGDEGWIEIPNASKTTDKKFDNGNYNYEQVQAIGYKGALTFTPDKDGSYMIECSATSLVTSRFDTEYTLIKVSDDVLTVTPIDNSWVENNMVSLVFLGIGGICLILIVILLFIKPKDSTESE